MNLSEVVMSRTLIGVLISIFTLSSHAAFELNDPTSLISYDGKVVRVQKAAGVAMTYQWWNMDTSPVDGFRWQIDSMIVNAYLQYGGKISWPDDKTQMSPAELMKALSDAKNKALKEIKDPAALKMIKALSQVLEQDKTAGAYCQSAIRAQKLTSEQQKLLQEQIKIQMNGATDFSAPKMTR
jgi:hypothetical protein